MPEPTTRPWRISHIGDLTLECPEGTLLVTDDRSYAAACRHVRATLTNSDPGTVWVQSKPRYHWLRRFMEQVGLQFQCLEQTARLVLAERWQVKPPEWLDDTTVIDQKLLNLTPGDEAGTSFSERLLCHFFGDLFAAPELVESELARVVRALSAPAGTEAFQQYPVLQKCLEEKIESWEEASPWPWFQRVLREFRGDFQGAWRSLTLWRLLRGYPPKLWGFVLAPAAMIWTDPIPRDAFVDLPLETKARHQALQQIKMFLEKEKNRITSGDQLKQLVARVSGRMAEEFKFVRAILEQVDFPITGADVAAVKQVFADCPGVRSGQLSELDLLVRPDPPSDPDPSGSWQKQQWIRWAMEEYLPYRSWQVHNRRYEARVEEAVGRFSDWYLRNYQTIQADFTVSLVGALHALNHPRSNNQFTVVLILDGVPASFSGLLDDALAQEGFHKQDRSYRLAPLPTSTDFSKPHLVSGQQDPDPKDYPGLLEKRAQSEWHGLPVRYVTTIKDLSNILPGATPQIVVFNFIETDKCLHQDVEQLNSTHAEELRRLFRRIAEALSQVLEAWQGKPEDFVIHTVSDHGACRILSEEQANFDSAVVNKLFPEEKHRYAVLSPQEQGNVPENLWKLGYRFQRTFNGDKNLYFLPRGHNTVRPLHKGNGYVHGGATPEEVIIPTATYSPVKIRRQRLLGKLVSPKFDPKSGAVKLYIQRRIELVIEVQNPNTDAATMTKAEIVAPEADLKGFDGTSVEPKATGRVTVHAYFEQSSLAAEQVEIELHYRLADEAHSLVLRLPCVFRSAMSGGLNLKDL